MIQRDFFTNSRATTFLKREDLDDNIIIDFDGRTYIRMMKKFKQTSESKMEFKEKITDISLNEELNKDFHLRFYLPKNIVGTIGKKIDKVVIMINGMNELDHFHFYDILGEYFASNDIGAVLLPTPLNLNRAIQKDVELKKTNKYPRWPTDRAADDNEQLFFASYLKTYKELNILTKKIKGHDVRGDEHDDASFFHNYFNGLNTEVSLLGYSLGGLKALGYFMTEFIPLDGSEDNDEHVENYIKNQKQTYHCCITINSGPHLYDVDTHDLGISQEHWRSLLGRVSKKLVNSKSYLPIKKAGISPNKIDTLLKYYNFLYFNHTEEVDIQKFGHKGIEGILNNYLAISGGADPIVAINQLHRLAPPRIINRGMKEKDGSYAINQLIVAKADHHPGMETSEWHEILPRVEKNILEFMESCGNRHYKRSRITEAIIGLIREAGKIDYVKENCTNQFRDCDFTEIIKALPHAKAELFKKYYFRSKVFYPHFPEIVSKIPSQ